MTGFTFQYGQIYYRLIIVYQGKGIRIYIPIWLDLLSNTNNKIDEEELDLHSNMVRFIISR